MKVISGGQVGADIAGLRAAKRLGLETGGYLPLGWTTLDGPKPEYEEWYSCQEYRSPKYPPRTFKNVKSSDATVRFAYNFETPGERCTLKAIKKYERPHLDINCSIFDGSMMIKADEIVAAREEFIEWLEDNNVQILNVAGNARPELERPVEQFLYVALREVKNRRREEALRSRQGSEEVVS